MLDTATHLLSIKSGGHTASQAEPAYTAARAAAAALALAASGRRGGGGWREGVCRRRRIELPLESIREARSQLRQGGIGGPHSPQGAHRVAGLCTGALGPTCILSASPPSLRRFLAITSCRTRLGALNLRPCASALTSVQVRPAAFPSPSPIAGSARKPTTSAGRPRGRSPPEPPGAGLPPLPPPAPRGPHTCATLAPCRRQLTSSGNGRTQHCD